MRIENSNITTLDYVVVLLFLVISGNLYLQVIGYIS